MKLFIFCFVCLVFLGFVLYSYEGMLFIFDFIIIILFLEYWGYVVVRCIVIIENNICFLKMFFSCFRLESNEFVRNGNGKIVGF